MTYRFEENSIWLTLGTIKEASPPPVAGVSSHIFWAEKASWFVVPDDGTPRHDQFGPDGQGKLDGWRGRGTKAKL